MDLWHHLEPMKALNVTDIENPTAIIVSVYRSGSTWVAELLYRNNGPDCRDEILAHIRRAWLVGDLTSKKDLQKAILRALEKQRQKTKQGSWGFKLMTSDWEMFAFAFDLKGNTLNSLQEFFPNTKIITVTRLNVLEQALSLYIALQTNEWHQYDIPKKQNVKLENLDLAKFLQCFKYISDETESLRNLITNSRGCIHQVSYDKATKEIINTVIGMYLASMKIYLPGDQIYQMVPLQKSNESVKNIIKEKVLTELISNRNTKADGKFQNGL